MGDASLKAAVMIVFRTVPHRNAGLSATGLEVHVLSIKWSVLGLDDPHPVLVV